MPTSKKVRHVTSPQAKHSRRAKGSAGHAQAAAPTPQSSDPLHKPVKPDEAPKSPLRARIDRALPPFTVQRYLAIWVLGMIPLVGVILILARPWDTSRQGGRATITPTPVQTQTPSVQSTSTAPQGTFLSLSTTPGAGRRTQIPLQAAPPDKYLVIETHKGRIVAKLRTAPSDGVARSVEGFVQKVGSGFFDGQQFHRVESWMVQGGDPYGTSRVTADYNTIPFGPGSLALPHGVDPDHNSDAQFIIFKSETPALDGEYTNLGQVIEGMDVVNQLAQGDNMTRVTVVDARQKLDRVR
jgi:cyclophilin family peptidyl-prolyl cis-trans isomerase